MKKILIVLAFATFSLVVHSQENPCPTVGGIRKTNVVNNGNGTCTATITLHITNDVSNANPKPVKVEVICSATGAPSVIQCFIASTVPGGADYTTDPFTCACNAPVIIRITRYTASNGECQGGTCGNVLIIQESPLPVTFTNFTAVRFNSNVSVKWETASEQNNSGFAVERNINGTWQQVAFVPTQAAGGNSDIKLSYSFNDFNPTKGISQYRIKQVDIDSKSKYTEVRSVRGDGQPGKTIVYPNPSNDGKVNIIFEDATVGMRNISVMDMSGRIVKQIKGVTNNNVQIEKLTPGMYSIRIVVVETGVQTIEKFVVNK